MNSKFALALIFFTRSLPAQDVPTVLPGKGLAEHDFLYAGEAKERRVFIIRKGQVFWSYDDANGKGEISDAVMLSNGTALLAHQFAVKLVSPEQKVLWNYDAPTGTEIHTAMPIGLDHVLFVQNGAPALAKVVNIRTGETKLEFELPVKNPQSVHGQFRHARINADGRLVVAHMDLGKIKPNFVCAPYEFDGGGVQRMAGELFSPLVPKLGA